MPIKKLTLGLSLFFAGVAAADAQQTYRIRSGDSISEIAAKFHVKTSALMRANGITPKTVLKLGRPLQIPAFKGSDRLTQRRVPTGSQNYAIRNGDHDWSLAARYGVTPSTLRRLNPGVNWRKLQIGQRITVPGATAAPIAVVSRPIKRAAGSYNVRAGDNDWIIARRFDVKPSDVRRLNPGINWSRLRPGQTLRVPGAGTAVAAKSAAVAPARRIRSRYAKVVKDSATIRTGPGMNAEVITTVPSGLRVVVLDRDGDWYKLRFPKGTEGWMRGDLIAAVSAPREVISTQKRKQTARRVAMNRPAKRRATGSISDPVLRETISSQSGSASTQRILTRASSFRGVRYRWGASSRSGTDCSGLTTQVFKSAGYRLPRTSVAQSKTGRPVGRGQLRAGDLVFFRTRGGSRVSHVGIYVGQGKFIHASSGGGRVQINSLSDGYYNRRFVTARRVVKDTGTKRTVAKKPAPKAPEVVTPQVTADPTPVVTDSPKLP